MYAIARIWMNKLSGIRYVSHNLTNYFYRDSILFDLRNGDWYGPMSKHIYSTLNIINDLQNTVVCKIQYCLNPFRRTDFN